MIAELICVGTELLMGQVLNTNAQFIAQELAESGGTECMMSFASILLTDKSVFAPTRETQYEKSEGPNVFPSPAVRTMLPDPDLTLEEAVTGLYVVQQGRADTRTT